MPDRRDTNFISAPLEIFSSSPFQCLIGAIQTFKGIFYDAFIFLFQCLIGAIQTRFDGAKILRKRQFQCLIGAIQTGRGIFPPFPDGLVSMPDRRDTNSSPPFVMVLLTIQFQCLIGAIQTLSLKFFSFISSAFQCLIGAIQTGRRNLSAKHPVRVSMPDRRDTNLAG